jgi:hypothetical protein
VIRAVTQSTDKRTFTMTKYYTNASRSGSVMDGQLASPIAVIGSPTGGLPIGTALAVGHTWEHLAVWRLHVGTDDLPGKFVIQDGEFVEVAQTAIHFEYHVRR